MKCPPNIGSEFHNYKGTFNIILFALVDAEYNFQYISIGANGCTGDAAGWRDCTSKRSSREQSILFPDNFVLEGDDAFPLKNNIMKPYSRSQLTAKEHVFNYHLSRSRD